MKVLFFLDTLKVIIEKTPQNSIAIFRASLNYDQKHQAENILDFLINLYFQAIEIKSTQVNSFFFLF